MTRPVVRRVTPVTPVTPFSYIYPYASARAHKGITGKSDVTGVTGVTDGSSAALMIETLADAVRRLSPHHRDPERFHVDKHTIAAELVQLARDIRKGGR